MLIDLTIPLLGGKDEPMTGSFQENVLGLGGKSIYLASQSTNACSIHFIILTPSDSIEDEGLSLSAHERPKAKRFIWTTEDLLPGETLGHRPNHEVPTWPTPALS